MRRPYRRNRTEAERSVIFLGTIAGDTLAAIDDRLQSIGARPLPQSSYDELMRRYVPYFLADPARIRAAIVHPPTRSDLARAGA